MDYLLCATPRAGSNLLGGLLFQTGVAGNPREYLCPTEINEIAPQLCGFKGRSGGSRLSRYYAAVREEFRVGDWFGLKLHFNQFQWALTQDFEFADHFPDRFIYLNRGDVVGQAFSLVRASQTDAWISPKPERRAPHFDPELISRAVQQITLEAQGWEAFFRTVDVEPYRVSYERLCADFTGEVEALLRYLDIDPDGLDVPAAVERATGYLRPQRDELSELWRRRYGEYLKERAREQRRALAGVL